MDFRILRSRGRFSRRWTPLIGAVVLPGIAGLAIVAASGTGTFLGYLAIVAALLLIAFTQFRAGYSSAQKEKETAENLLDTTITALAMAFDAKDHRTYGSICKVRDMALKMAIRLGIKDPLTLEGLQMASLLHDIGKLAVPEYILSKPGKLTEGEAAKLREHPLIGASILQAVPFPYPVVPLVRHHHERWDGSGYPDGLKGEEIPLGSRILSVVDCYVNLRSDRPFRPRLSRELAYDFIRLESGTAFDPAIVDTFIACAEELESSGDPPVPEDPGLYSQAAMEPPIIQEVFADIASTQREMQAVFEITQNIGRSLDLTETLTQLVTKVRQFVPYSACSVYLLNAGDNRLLPQHSAGMFTELLQGAELHLQEGVSGWVAANNRPLINASPDLDFPHIPPLQKTFRSCLAVPLAVDATVIGVLTLYSTTPGEYDEESLRLVEAVAPHSARAISNAVIFEATHEDAYTDSLTGLPNLRSLAPTVTEELNRARRVGYPVSFLMMDLDGFKRVNDRYGHQNGDALLVEVGKVLRGQLRKSDTCLRYGGDEFLALLPGLDRALAQQAASRIQAAFSAKPFLNINGDDIAVGISIGVSTFPVDGIDIETLVRTADQDMFRNKGDRARKTEHAPHLIPFRRSDTS